jgi:hypothetical protein
MMETAERQELMQALGHNCHCVWDAEGNISSVCALHEDFVNNEESFSNHMEFARSLRDRWNRGEWSKVHTLSEAPVLS